MADYKMSKEVAEKIIQRSDQDKGGFIRFAYDQDWLNANLYDLVLNTDKLSVESAVQVVADSARSEEINACGIDSVKELGKLSLHRKVESALLESRGLERWLVCHGGGLGLGQAVRRCELLGRKRGDRKNRQERIWG